MDSLPVELLTKILASCDSNSLKNLRLTSRVIKDYADHPLVWRNREIIPMRRFFKNPDFWGLLKKRRIQNLDLTNIPCTTTDFDLILNHLQFTLSHVRLPKLFMSSTWNLSQDLPNLELDFVQVTLPDCDSCRTCVLDSDPGFGSNIKYLVPRCKALTKIKLDMDGDSFGRFQQKLSSIDMPHLKSCTVVGSAAKLTEKNVTYFESFDDLDSLCLQHKITECSFMSSQHFSKSGKENRLLEMHFHTYDSYLGYTCKTFKELIANYSRLSTLEIAFSPYNIGDVIESASCLENLESLYLYNEFGHDNQRIKFQNVATDLAGFKRLKELCIRGERRNFRISRHFSSVMKAVGQNVVKLWCGYSLNGKDVAEITENFPKLQVLVLENGFDNGQKNKCLKLLKKHQTIRVVYELYFIMKKDPLNSFHTTDQFDCKHTEVPAEIGPYIIDRVDSNYVRVYFNEGTPLSSGRYLCRMNETFHIPSCIISEFKFLNRDHT